MAELFLHTVLVHLGTTRQTRPQGMAGIETQAFGLRKFRAQAGLLDGLLDEPGDVVVGKLILRGLQPIA